MLIIPAIDLLGGTCVNLRQGAYDAVTRYTGAPAEIAQDFAAAGAAWLHLVDLDAARSSGSTRPRGNRAAIAEIRRQVPGLKIQVGGGVSSRDAVARLLDDGIDRVLVGSALVRVPRRVAQWCREFPGRLAAAMDALEGAIKVTGWTEGTGLRDTQLATDLQELGLCGVVYTSIHRDGMLSGPDLPRTRAVAAATSLPLIVSGGVSSPADLEAVAAEGGTVRGVIIGKALYEGKVDLTAALQAYPASPDAW